MAFLPQIYSMLSHCTQEVKQKRHRLLATWIDSVRWPDNVFGLSMAPLTNPRLTQMFSVSITYLAAD